MLPEAINRLLSTVGLATLAAFFGGIGTALAIKAVQGDSVVLFALLAALMLGLAIVAALGAVIAAAGGRSKAG